MDQLLYLLAAALYLVRALAPWSRGLRRFLEHPALLGVAVGAHLLGLGLGVVEQGRIPLDSMRWGLSSLGLWVTLAWLYLRRRPQMEVIGSVLLGLAFGFTAAAQAGGAGDAPGQLDTIWFPVHVGLLFLGFLLLALAFSSSGTFLLVRRRLKRKQLSDIGRLPSLESLDRLNFQAMALGFVALTAGMAVGGMWALSHPDATMARDATVYGTLAVWVWYAAGLYVRLALGWRGRLAAIFGVVGFGGLAGIFAVALVLLGGWHGLGA